MAKMHQIRVWLGLCPRLPDPLAGFKGPVSNGRERRGKEEGERRGSPLCPGYAPAQSACI